LIIPAFEQVAPALGGDAAIETEAVAIKNKQARMTRILIGLNDKHQRLNSKGKFPISRLKVPKLPPYSQMSDQLTKMGAKSRKIKYIWFRY
jgi:hypothetical protein